MSEFECYCGAIMIHGVCPKCGNKYPAYMDGLSENEIVARDQADEQPEDEEE